MVAIILMLHEGGSACSNFRNKNKDWGNDPEIILHLGMEPKTEWNRFGVK